MMGVGCPCPPICNDIVTPRHLFRYHLSGISLSHSVPCSVVQCAVGYIHDPYMVYCTVYFCSVCHHRCRSNATYLEPNATLFVNRSVHLFIHLSSTEQFGLVINASALMLIMFLCQTQLLTCSLHLRAKYGLVTSNETADYFILRQRSLLFISSLFYSFLF